MLESEIRQLARSYYYQSLYNISLETGNINFFNNKDNYSSPQINFLYWLRVYNKLYKEISEQEWLNLDEEVIKDDIRTDAFLYWRSKRIEAEFRKYKEEMRKTNKKSRGNGRSEGMKVWQGKNNGK